VTTLSSTPRRAARATLAVALVCAALGAALPGTVGFAHAARAQGSTGAAPAPVVIRGRQALRAAPLRFEANAGQFSGLAAAGARPAYVARGRGYTLALAAAGATLTLQRLATARAGRTAPVTPATALQLNLAGSDPHARLVGEGRLPGATNYLLGRAARAWRRGVPSFARVTARGVYPGVDISYYGRGDRLEYDLALAPGADVARIRLAVTGARAVGLDARGGLRMIVPGGAVVQPRPVIYQEISGRRQGVAGGYTLLGRGVVGLRVGRYDSRRPLVIDPVVDYATYLGGSDDDEANGVAVDSAGAAYVVGVTSSADLQAKNPYQASNKGVDTVFVTKLTPGGAVAYQTYLGGGGGDIGAAIAVDASGDAYLTGSTNSTDFPVDRALQPHKGGGNDAFVAELDPSGGTLLYGTYLGGAGEDAGRAIALNSAGDLYVAGQTASTNFPVAQALQTSYKGGDGDGFVTVLAPDRTHTVYSTYLGGAGLDTVNGIAVDGANNAYVAGSADSTDFITSTAALGPSYGAGMAAATGSDAVVTKLTPSGALGYSAYLGGSGDDEGNGIAVDAAGHAYVTGVTYSTDFPTTTGAFSIALAAGGTAPNDAFVTELDTAGHSLVYGTLLGGGGDDTGYAVALDPAGDAYVVGGTTSRDFPLNNPVQASNHGASGIFVTKVDPAGKTLLYSTYLGGSGDNAAYGVAVTGTVSGPNAVYVAGFSSGFDFPTTNAAQSSNGGGNDAIALRLDESTGGSIGGGNQTPELGSGDLLATGLIPLVAALLYRRQRRKSKRGAMSAMS